ncbi:MAG: hypothetical protein U5L04_03535 [Trueperaceae bacterium]|nr:hypothetical protein [Trueperaceae bacterium]
MRHDDAVYLLRLWRDGSSPHAWRAALENVRGDDTRQFASLAALAEHLAHYPESLAGDNGEPSEVS